MLVKIEDIIVRKRMRKVNAEKVNALVESIKVNGQINPIIICGNNQLVAGAHRLAACKVLGDDVISADFMGDINDPDSLQLIEIDENLFRNELSPAEKAEHIARRVEIIAKRNEPKALVEVAEKYKKIESDKGSRKVSDKVNQKVSAGAKKKATAEAKKEVSSILATNTTNVTAAINNHKAVTEAELDVNLLEELNDTQYKRVARVAKTQGAEAAKIELLEQATKPTKQTKTRSDNESGTTVIDGSIIAHDSSAKLKQDIGVLTSARSLTKRLKPSGCGALEAMYYDEAFEAIDALISHLKTKTQSLQQDAA